MAKTDFKKFAQQLAALNGRGSMQPVIEKELLHYEILRAMSEAGLLSSIIFQGGTCLRLCYGANRYSEDLDFAGGLDFAAPDLAEIKRCIEQALPDRYLVTAKVKEPLDASTLVKKWTVRIDTSPGRPDLASQKISLEVASIPAYTKQTRMLQLNYEGLPRSFEDVVLFTESVEEILADKLESFICSSHLRYRDLWDMHWLSRRPNLDAERSYELRRRKALDYNEAKRFAERLPYMLARIEQLIESKEFHDQMKRFLPTNLFERTIGREEYRMALAQNICELYENV